MCRGEHPTIARSGDRLQRTDQQNLTAPETLNGIVPDSDSPVLFFFRRAAKNEDLKATIAGTRPGHNYGKIAKEEGSPIIIP